MLNRHAGILKFRHVHILLHVHSTICGCVGVWLTHTDTHTYEQHTDCETSKATAQILHLWNLASNYNKKNNNNKMNPNNNSKCWLMFLPVGSCHLAVSLFLPVASCQLLSEAVAKFKSFCCLSRGFAICLVIANCLNDTVPASCTQTATFQ